jgi:type IV secretory pathway ATPase VirB11/archaellum biosynthesis ATPase
MKKVNKKQESEHLIKTPSLETPKPRQFNKSKIFPSVIEKITILGTPKLDQFLQDPGVLTIECPGPEKPVVIYKDGVIQPTNVSLSLDEIESIMKEISDKTRIPLQRGTFKAALHKFVITAVMSDFIGTKFIIQKKIDNEL